MGLIIDTNVFIDAAHHRLVFRELTALNKYGEAYIAAITASELLAGVHLAKTPNARIQRSAFQPLLKVFLVPYLAYPLRKLLLERMLNSMLTF